MRLDCETAREHLDAWALGGLDAYDARTLESHLAACPDCTRLADDAREHAALVAMAVPLRSSSATLKARIMASARALNDIGRHGVSRWWRAGAVAAAAAAIAAVAWGSIAQMRMDDARDQRATIAVQATADAALLSDARTQVVTLIDARAELDDTIAEQSAVLEIVLRPDTESVALEGTAIAPSASGRCVWSRTQALGAFVAENLPTPPRGKAYHMWLVYERAWINGGSFDIDEEGRGHLILRRIWGAQEAGELLGFAVTIEDANDPLLPSDTLVLTGPPKPR
jgi:hypothetical protein